MNRLTLPLLSAIVLLALAGRPTPAADAPPNPLYEELRTKGVAVNAATSVPLPAPAMTDGLDAAAQQDIMKKLVGGKYPWAAFRKGNIPAPFVMKLQRRESSDPDTPVYEVDVSFIARGSLATVADKKFLQRLESGQKNRKVHILTAEELAKRGLKVEQTDQRDERFSHAVFEVLERVEVSAALHTVVTRQAESLVAATRLDPRFVGDAQFSDQWRRVSRDDDGRRQLGPPNPYTGAGGYLKITRLKDPQGALFVEYHLVYTEPRGWFGGKDPLRSKLRTLIEAEVRAFRTELAKVKK